MPRINIYEHSDTYSFQVKNRAYGCVALPITAIWGPAYDGYDEDNNPDWLYFTAGFRGTTDFVNTFKGPNATLGSRDKSYDYALKLLASGYDILVKRADGLGANAKRNYIFFKGNSENANATLMRAGNATSTDIIISAVATEPGTLGNRIKVQVEPQNYAVAGTDYEYDTESTKWVMKKEFKQQLLINIYVTPYEQSGIDCMTITPEDVMVESHQVSCTYPVGEFGLINLTGFTSNYISSISVEGICTADTWTEHMVGPAGSKKAVLIMTLGKVVSAEFAPDVTWEQSGQAGVDGTTTGKFGLQAKYPGSYGNELKVRIKVGTNSYGRNIGTIEVFDRNGYTNNPNNIVRTDQLLEMQSVSFDINAATDAQPYVTEVTFSNLGTVSIQNEEVLQPGVYVTSLLGGTDYAIEGNGIDVTLMPIDRQIVSMVRARFSSDNSSFVRYISDLVGNSTTVPEVPGTASHERVIQLWNQQKTFDNAMSMMTELTDPLSYDWDAFFMGIADDQYIPVSWLEKNPSFVPEYEPTKAHLLMLEVAANSKCGAAFIGTPFGMKRGTYYEQTGQATGAIKFMNDLSAMAGANLSTFGELVGPWCKTTLPISGANSWVTPELAHLLLIINAQGVGGQNKWWMVPAGMMGTGVVHTPEYRIKKAYLDIIQNHDEGTCMNPLMQVPGKGFTCFGNSTLWNKPLGTYNALQNLSTRLLTNRVKQRIWDTALQILFKYNNENAYSHFYAGVSPLLDEMRAVGALTSTESNPWGYRIIMNPDIINLDRINANTVIGKVELAVTGVIDTVEVDLFLLPPTAFQSEV